MSHDHLSIKDLSVVYQTRRGTTHAIDRLNVNVGKGEFVAVLGPSGCGKSTLLQIISGLLRPSSGSASLGGRDITSPRHDVGVVFQTPTLLPWKSIFNNVMMPISALRLPQEQYRQRARELLELVGLDAFSHHYPRELSGGMQQRVSIARGLIHDPEVLLMDEPFAALDAMTREEMSVELQSLWLKANKSIMFITHSIPEAVFLADRVVVLSSRPARVQEIVDVALPRPRSIDVMGDSRFIEIATHLRSLFKSKAQAAAERTS